MGFYQLVVGLVGRQHSPAAARVAFRRGRGNSHVATAAGELARAVAVLTILMKSTVNEFFHRHMSIDVDWAPIRQRFCSNSPLARACLAWFSLAIVCLLSASRSRAGDATWGSNGNSAWYTGSNWAGGAFPGSQGIAASNTNTATFTSAFTGTTVGINMNTGNSLNLGAISLDSTRTTATNIGDSGATAGSLRLYGATVNGVSNVILRNNGSGDVTLQAAQNGTMEVVLGNATANIVNIDSSGNVVISSVISGSGKALTVNTSSGGDLRLSGANVYNGGTNIGGGTSGARLRIDALKALPTTGTVAISTGGRLTLNVGGTYGGVSQALTFNPNQTTRASLDIASDSGVEWQGTVAINADTRIETTGGAGALTFSGTLSGSGTLIKQEAGTLILSGPANSATGGTQIGNGTVSVSSGSALGTGALTMAQVAGSSSSLELNNATQSIKNLSSTFTDTTGTRSQTITLAGTALTVNQTGATTFGNGAVSTLTSTIVGSGGSVTLAGTSTAVLSFTGANSYTGGTTISGGRLEVNNVSGSGTGTGSVSVQSGGTLRGKGSISGNVSVAGAGVIGAGTGGATTDTFGAFGNLTTGTLTLSPNSTFEWRVSRLSDSGTQTPTGSWDTLTVSNLALSGFASGDRVHIRMVFINTGATTSINPPFVIPIIVPPPGGTLPGGLAGQFTLDIPPESGVPTGTSAERYSVTQLGDGSIAISYTPEPASPLLAGAFAGCALLRRRRRISMRTHS